MPQKIILRMLDVGTFVVLIQSSNNFIRQCSRLLNGTFEIVPYSSQMMGAHVAIGFVIPFRRFTPKNVQWKFEYAKFKFFKIHRKL